ncbi:hypothetical protein MLD38_009704 [Melastoma candidum]|uniref:Uncharacterized protein n=1 Tax=Melastoma candidum TaxID=119954 RepID=A0ACB9RYD1_9MYRT|nr:hypothetical protein MLD38_009704 [Melastoma candidum]
MDGYYGRGIDLLPVPHDQELSDRLPSPNSWSRWGVLRPGALGEENMLPDDGSNGGACGARLGVLQDDCRFDVCLSLLDDYHPGYGQSRPTAEESVHDFLYGNSSLDDLQSAENGRQHGPLCLCSQCDRDVIPSGDSWFDLISSPGLQMSAEMSAELEEQSLSESRDLDDGGGETPAVPLNMKGHAFDTVFASERQVTAQCWHLISFHDSRPYNGKIFPSGQSGQQHYPDVSESSSEEVALEDLKMAVTLLSDWTRICLRDALYRLADNSKQRLVRADGQERGSSIRKPPLTLADKRSPKGPNESKTNVIDRAVANIMFNRMDSWSQEDRYSASAHAGSNTVNLCACVAQCSPDWNLPAIYLDENDYQCSQEFEVPGLSEEAMAE